MEVNFKGKVTDEVAKLLNFGDDRWVDGYYYKDLCNGVLKSFITDGAHKFEVIENSVRPFTGIFDDDGNMIYEGDIVSCSYTNYPDYKDTVAEVIFDCGAFSIKADDYWPALYDIWNIKVIGNVFDNPELLNHDNIKGSN